MMKKTLKVVATVVAVTAMGTLAACKVNPMAHDPKKLKAHVDSKLKSVGATEEQRTKIVAIADRILADCGEIHKNNKGLQQKFVGCLLLDTPNREWLHRTVDEKTKELAEFAHRTVDSLIEISGTLTPGQRAEIKKQIEAKAEKTNM